MKTFLLSDLEDRMLALSEDDYAHPRMARVVFSVYYGRAFDGDHVWHVVHRLAALGLVRWRVLSRGRFYFRTRLARSSWNARQVWFVATEAGKHHLRKPREVDPARSFVEGNRSGDDLASRVQQFIARGGSMKGKLTPAESGA